MDARPRLVMSAAGVLALLLVTATVLGAAPGARPAPPADAAGHAEYAAVGADAGPLSVLPTRTSVDERDATGAPAPWRIAALAAALTLLVGPAVLVGRRSPLAATPRRLAARHWARFRAPPAPEVPTLRG